MAVLLRLWTRRQARKSCCRNHVRKKKCASTLQVDRPQFISLDGLVSASVGRSRGAQQTKCPQYCDACFSGADYPVTPTGPDQSRVRDEASRPNKARLLPLHFRKGGAGSTLARPFCVYAPRRWQKLCRTCKPVFAQPPFLPLLSNLTGGLC